MDFKKPKEEEDDNNGATISSSNPTISGQAEKYMTQVFLIPRVSQFKTNKVRRARLKYSNGHGSSTSGSCDSGATQSTYMGESDSSQEDQKQSKTEEIISSPIKLSNSRLHYAKKRCYVKLSQQECLPIPEGVYSIFSEKESGNESGYSSHSTSYMKESSTDKGIDNFMDNSDQFVDIDNLESKQNGVSEDDSSSSDKKMRFLRTASVLQRSGLMNITMKTAEILKQNRILNKEIEKLHQDTLKFLQSVIKNPENKCFQDTIPKNCDKHS